MRYCSGVRKRLIVETAGKRRRALHCSGGNLLMQHVSLLDILRRRSPSCASQIMIYKRYWTREARSARVLYRNRWELKKLNHRGARRHSPSTPRKKRAPRIRRKLAFLCVLLSFVVTLNLAHLHFQRKGYTTLAGLLAVVLRACYDLAVARNHAALQRSTRACNSSCCCLVGRRASAKLIYTGSVIGEI